MRCTLLIVCLVVSANFAWAAQDLPNLFTDVPKGRWEYKTFKALRSAGLAALSNSSWDPSVHFGTNRGLTRFEVAVWADWILRTTDRSSVPPRGLNADTAPLLHRLLGEYTKELAAIGRSKANQLRWIAYLRQIERSDQPFVDIPSDHWAFESVDRLRREGILKGYPDGLFHGE